MQTSVTRGKSLSPIVISKMRIRLTIQPEPAYIIDRDPGPITPPATSRVSTEIDPLPSVHHQSIYSSHLHKRDWDDKDRDEKDIYAAPTIHRNQSEKKQVGFWRRITPSSSICRILLAVVIIESLVDLAILVSTSWTLMT
jgi:hypothetical protein